MSTPIVLKEDNKASISFFDHPGNHRNSKHSDYRHHFVREGAQRGDISMEYIETKFQLADIFTKALDALPSLNSDICWTCQGRHLTQ